MHREVAARSPQEGVVVIGGEHGLYGDDAVTAGTVVDHDRLAPFLLQLFLDQPRADIGAGARPERNDPAHRALRPALRLRAGRHGDQGQACQQRRGQSREPVFDVVHGVSPLDAYRCAAAVDRYLDSATSV
jgi:hypothetical protein